MQKRREARKGQVSIEYLIIIGFVTFIIIGILAMAFVYSGTIKDKIKMTQVTNFANKIISTAESVFYAGEPSKATITVYLPENVGKVDISEVEDSLIITIQTSSGLNKIGFSSRVPISGTLSSSPGLKRIQIVAQVNRVVISQA